MNPAQAMGTFLKTWRAEWAGMSRQQLAIAVSGLLNNSKTVSPTIIREWEDGQPPKTTAELEALCQVMGRNRLGEHEVLDFRRYVLAACGARQYPELFDDADFAYRPDVLDIAEARVNGERQPAWGSFLLCVAACAELERAVAEEAARGIEDTAARRRRAALVCWRHCLGYNHGMAGRGHVAARLRAHNAELVRQWFGADGLGGDLTVLGQQFRAEQAWANEARFGPGGPGDPARVAPARRYMAVRDAACARGDSRLALEAAAHAAAASWHLPPPEAQDVLALAERLLVEVDLEPTHLQYRGVHGFLFWGACQAGRFDLAHQHLEAGGDWRTRPLDQQADWFLMASRLELARGDLEAVQKLLEQGLALADQIGYLAKCMEIHNSLEGLEREQHAGRHRKARSRKVSRKSSTNKD